MNLSLPGTFELIGHEAIVLTRYRDSVGVWTIGIGHTFAAGPPNPATFTGELSLDETFDLFTKDIVRYVADVNAVLKVPVSQTQFDALVSFHYNTGAIRRATFVKALNRGEITAAGHGFMDWTKNPEVISRRKKEQILFETGRYSNNGRATIYPATASGAILWKRGKTVDLNKALSNV